MMDPLPDPLADAEGSEIDLDGLDPSALRRMARAERAQRIAAERRLAERNVALDRAFDGVALTDAEGVFVYMNDSHARMFGSASGAGWIGRSWKELYAPEEIAMFESVVFPQLLETGGWRGEVAGRREDGAPVHQEVTLSFLETGLLCVTRDIGVRRSLEQDRRRLSERLLSAQALATLGRFSAELSHDFGAVIGAAAHNADVLAHAGADAATRAAALEGLQSSLERARGLTDRMLSVGRSQPTAMAEVDLAAVVAETFDLVFSSSDAHARFSGAGDGGAALIGDRTQLEQLCANMLFNADQASRAGRARDIDVRLWTVDDLDEWRSAEAESWPFEAPWAAREVGFGDPDGPWWVVSVLDRGAGISEDDLQKLFQPFYTTKRGAARGHGVGLLSIETCLETHSGRIRYRSAPGRGTLVSVALPRNPTALARPRSAAAGPRVLVVDDDPSDLAALAASLQADGMAPHPYQDPAKALVAFAADPGFAAVITDCVLGDISGADLALAAARTRPEVPIFAVSSSQAALDAVCAQASPHLTDAVLKPMDAAARATLAEAIRLGDARAP